MNGVGDTPGFAGTAAAVGARETAAAWPDVLAGLLRGEDLPAPVSRWAMEQVMTGAATPAQVAAFVVALRAKGESAAEIGALVEVMLNHAVAVDVPGTALDVVGTGGDRAHTVNISTMAALVCAAAGVRVVKHGNRAASSLTGTADVLERLGLPLALGPREVAACVDAAGIAFCFAAAFHPALRHAGPVRREIGVPTVFNVLGPLANPARPAAALVGCADRRLAPVLAAVLAGRGVSALVVRGEDGLDEITVYGATRVWDATAGDGSVRECVVDAAAYGIEAPAAGALVGGDADVNAAVLRSVLGGSRTGRDAAVSDAVALNAAAGLVAAAAVADSAAAAAPVGDRLAPALQRARDVLASGDALVTLDRWIDVAQGLATTSA
ncbi:MAG: anthranilate phosphoribosyltransferase [Actinomycetota bacterium]|nr:MAG: anthranilate phosphoribosyltransferase [Actinomycetota bacterium]